MPKFLLHGSYTLDGIRGLLKEGGSSRRSVFKKNVENLGGQVEAFYYAFGGEDVYATLNLPDNIDCAALSLALSAGGGFRCTMTVLITPEEIDQSVKKIASIGYRPPGGVQ